MQHSDLVRRTADYVQATLSNEGSGHDWWHVYRVWKMAERIGVAEHADLLIVELSALLHDVADWKAHGGDPTVGPAVARRWLASLLPGKLGDRPGLPHHPRHVIQRSSRRAA